jgi:hypothetical protein
MVKQKRTRADENAEMDEKVRRDAAAEEENDRELELYYFSGEMADASAAIETSLNILREDEFESEVNDCIEKLVFSDSRDMITVATKMLLLIKRRRQNEFQYDWASLDVEAYAEQVWTLAKRWTGIGVKYLYIDYDMLIQQFESLQNTLCFLMEFKTTHLNITAWTEKVLEIADEVEEEHQETLEEEEEELPTESANAIIMSEEFEKMSFIEKMNYKTQMFQKNPAESQTKYRIYYMCNLAFHMWQTCFLQDMFRSIHWINTFRFVDVAKTIPSTEVKLDEQNAAFVAGVNHFVRLALKGPIAKDVRIYLTDTLLNELWLPGMRGTSTNSTSIVTVSIWKRALPADITNLMVRIKECKNLDDLWVNLNGDGAYDMVLRHAIARYTLVLKFMQYIPTRLLYIHPIQTADIDQMFHHYGWFGIRSKHIYANGWDAPFLIFHEWLKMRPECLFHLDFIKKVSLLSETSERLPQASTAGALSVTNLPSHIIVSSGRRKTERLLRDKHH